MGAEGETWLSILGIGCHICFTPKQSSAMMIYFPISVFEDAATYLIATII